MSRFIISTIMATSILFGVILPSKPEQLTRRASQSTGTVRIASIPDPKLIFPPDTNLKDLTSIDCSNLFELEVKCLHEDCAVEQVTSANPVCHSKLFQFHGGSCTTGSRSTSKTSLETCYDVHDGDEDNDALESSYIVVSALDRNPTTVYYAGYIRLSEYFKISSPSQQLLSDYLNVTLYNSNMTTYENMQQTMIIYNPCEEFNQEIPDRRQDHFGIIQMIGSAMEWKPESTPHATLDFRLASNGGDESWIVESLTMATSVDPGYHNLTDAVNGYAVNAGEMFLLEYDMPIEQTQPPTLKRATSFSALATAEVTTKTGKKCWVHSILDNE